MYYNLRFCVKETVEPQCVDDVQIYSGRVVEEKVVRRDSRSNYIRHEAHLPSLNSANKYISHCYTTYGVNFYIEKFSLCSLVSSG